MRKLKSLVNSFLLRQGKVAASFFCRFIILNKDDRREIKSSLRLRSVAMGYEILAKEPGRDENNHCISRRDNRQ